MSVATRCRTQTLVIASIVRCLFASAWGRASSVWRVWGLLRVQLLLSPRLPLFLLVLVVVLVLLIVGRQLLLRDCLLYTSPSPRDS